jgi:plasmid replication initiation protein
MQKTPNSMVVYQSNAIVEASYRLTTIEKKLLLACIVQVRHDQLITDELMYSVSAEDIARLGGISVDTGYEHLQEAAKRLLDRVVSIAYEPNGGKKHPRILRTHWVQSVEYIDKEARVNLRFSKDMLPYINQLTKQFTHYNITAVGKMQSIHGIRLYEMLAQWQFTGHREVEIEWLKKQFDIKEKYKSIYDLKLYVIEPAIKEINEHSDISCTWEHKKTGRRVTHIVFTFKPKKISIPKKLQKEIDKTEKKTSSKKEKQNNMNYIDHKTQYPPYYHEVMANIRPGETFGQCKRRLIELEELEKKIDF